MAAVERRGGGSTPDGFSKLMLEAGFQNMELSGFTGKKSTEINTWYKRGLGRAIGFPLFDKAGRTRPGEFRGVMFALPLVDTDKPDIYQSALLLIPTETTCRFAVIGPKKSSYNGEAARKSQEETFARDFHAIFSPSKDPFYPDGWAPHNARVNVDAFFSDPSVLDPSIDVRLADIPKDKEGHFLEKALQSAEIIAERNTERERVRNLPVDEASLEAAVGTEIVNGLDVLNEFLLRAGERQKEEKAHVDDVLAVLENELVADLETQLYLADPGNQALGNE